MSDHLQEDFPIEWEEDHFVTRREFFKFLTLASGGIAVGTTALALIAKLPRTERRFEPAQICTVADLRPGSALPFTYPCPTDLCILVCTREGEYRAFTRRCTHLSCPVVYRADERGEQLFCPCHNGAFSVEDGRVLQGPPPHPLPEIMLEVRGDQVWALGVRRGEHA